MSEYQRLLEAADWLDRQDSLTSVERQQFQQWLQDSANQAAYKRVSGTMELPEVSMAMTSVPEQESLQPVFAETLSTQASANDDAVRKKRYWAWTVAASLLLAVVVTWGLQTTSTSQPTASALVADSGFSRQQAVSVDNGTVGSKALDDGSMVYLNAASQLTVKPARGKRLVSLQQGQAYFDVARNEKVPFEVQLGEATVQVLGTSFDIDRMPQATVITVYSGRVRVSHQQQYDLVRGQQLTIDATGDVTQKQVVLETMPAWRNGWLEADAMPLAQVISKLQRYSNSPIKLQSQAMGEMAVDGRFPLQTPIKAVELLSQAYQLSVDKQPDAIYLRPL